MTKYMIVFETMPEIAKIIYIGLRETADANREEMPLITMQELIEPQFISDYEVA